MNYGRIKSRPQGGFAALLAPWVPSGRLGASKGLRQSFVYTLFKEFLLDNQFLADAKCPQKFGGLFGEHALNNSVLCRLAAGRDHPAIR